MMMVGAIGTMGSGVFVGSAGRNTVHTYSGVNYDFVNPNSAYVRVDDIAHHLSRICRFTGASKMFYSVAEHSVIVHDMMARDFGTGRMSLAGLIHDAPEAYLGDVSRPLKHAIGGYDELRNDVVMLLGLHSDAAPDEIVRQVDLVFRRHPSYHELERRNMDAIALAFGIHWDDDLAFSVKRYDNMACRAEAFCFMESAGEDWDWGDTPLCADLPLVGYLPNAAKTAWMDRVKRYLS